MKVVSYVAVAALAAGAIGALPPTVNADDTSRISALVLLDQLREEDEVATPYDRDMFTTGLDEDGDGCNTQAEVLIAESRGPVEIEADCRVRRGDWLSRYDGLKFARPHNLAVDRLVTLAEAWQSGASLWSRATRNNFANDLGYRFSQIAVSKTSRQSKGDLDPAEWLPRTQYQCNYAKQYTAVKYRWDLTVDAAERSELEALITGCANPDITEPELAKIVFPPTDPVVIGDWAMNETSGPSMVDTSGNGLTGQIGADVDVNTPILGGGTGYHFEGPLTVKDQERLVTVPDNPLLDPGTDPYSVSIRFRTTGPRPNIIQKGQSEDSGGYWKLVIHTGWPRCHFRDEFHNTKAIGFVDSPDPDARVDDGAWHVLRCERTATQVCVYLDEGTPDGMKKCINGTIGLIDNKWPLTIGGKYRCDPLEAATTCDYFNGDIDWVRIERP